MKKLAISNQKGGVGKTTIAIHIALQAKSMGYKVLFVDLDIQANSSMFMQEYIEKSQNLQTMSMVPTAQLFSEDSDLSAIQNKELGLCFADTDFADLLTDDNLDIDAWKQNLDTLNEHFDLCVIDTPPTLSTSQIAAMVIADYVISPIELNNYSVQGVINFSNTVDGIKAHYNPNLEFLGLIPSRVNKNNHHQLSILAELQKEFADRMFPGDFYIPERQAFSETSSLFIPIWEFKQKAAKKVANNVRPYFEYIVNKVMIEEKKGR